MTETPTAVTYVGLPVSSGGAHSLGRMSRGKAYEQTIAFLETCAELVGPIGYAFAAHDVPQLRPVPDLERKLRQRFGNYTAIDARRVREALDFLDEIDPQPTNPFGMAPVWFSVGAAFRVLDPATGSPMPGQDPDRYRGVEYAWGVALGSSGLRLRLHGSAQLAIELCLPDADEAMLRRIVPWLQGNLPFRLSPKQWRAWRPTKSGSFTSRRIAPPAWR